MSTSLLGLAIEALVAVLLIMTIGYCWVLNKRVTRLRADETTLRGLKPQHHLLRELPVRGVIATARGDGEFDFVSRFFAPGSGIDEDPVTGSAHTAPV